MEVCNFYKQHYENIQNFIISDAFPKNCQRNNELLKLVRDNDFKTEFIKICDSYSHFQELIVQSESRSFTIKKAYDSFNNIKWDKDYLKINEYAVKRWESNLLRTMVETEQKNPEYESLMNCVATSVEVERLFSKLNNMLSKNRPFASENLVKYFFFYCHET